MRKLIVLRGAMGVGKSTFIKEKGLENYTLSSDKIRLMFASLTLTDNYSLMVPQHNNERVWELLFSILEFRMKKGEFTVIDAVHAKADDFCRYKSLAEKYRYRVYVVDFSSVPIQEVYKRNQSREDYKIVPEESIDRVYKNFKKEKIPKFFKIIKPEEIDSLLENIPRDFNRFDNMHIIGDIHGCYDVLVKYFNDFKFNKNDAYVFVGDYFDRGLKNYETFKYLEELMKEDNTFFLLGNHEDKLYKYACCDEFKVDYDIKNTILEFEACKLDKKRIRGFIKNLSQILFINFKEKTYLISHGGLPYFPKQSIDLVSTDSFVYGALKYDSNIDYLYNEYMKKQDKKIYQVHGHRNFHNVGVNQFEYSFNLEDDVENGGHLVVLNLNKDGSCDYVKIKNDNYNKNLKEEITIYNLVQDFCKNKYIFVKDLGDNLCSFNFTKEAFYSRIWNNLTVRARGLFIDVALFKIVARSYDKFFNLNEYKYTEKNLLEKLSFPLNIYLKYNGFLGILSHRNDELFFSTKSTNQGEYVNYFKEIFYKTFTKEQIDEIKNFIIKNDVSFVFEVIDCVNDSHIIKYENNDLILLDAIYNTSNFNKLSYENLEELSSRLGIKIKERICQIKDAEKLNTFLNDIRKDDFKYHEKWIEGVVLESKDNFMIKIKTSYYTTWKRLRNFMEYAVKSNQFACPNNDELSEKFLSFLQNKYENKSVDIKKINLIDEREEFLKENN